MDTAFDRYYRLMVRIILITAVLLLLYLAIKYFLSFFAPFLLAFVLALINEPVISLLEKKVKVPRKFAALISLLVTIGIFGGLLVLVIVGIYSELLVLKSNISTYISGISAQLTAYVDKINAYYNALPSNITGLIDENLKSITPKLEDVVKSLINYSIDTIKSLPQAAIFIIVTMLATYFISSDRKEIRGFLYKQFPENWVKNFYGVKSGTFSAIFGYFKAVFILMVFTFIEATVGFFIIHADYALVMGLLVAICEVIPIFGTGLIMLPWIAWNLLVGNMSMALGLSIIYLLGILIRQIMEPKIVGDQIGLHPLVTLVSMYIGLGLFGVLGMLIGPICVIILKNINESGLLNIWKR